jgi:hypothetical protein
MLFYFFFVLLRVKNNNVIKINKKPHKKGVLFAKGMSIKSAFGRDNFGKKNQAKKV